MFVDTVFIETFLVLYFIDEFQGNVHSLNSLRLHEQNDERATAFKYTSSLCKLIMNLLSLPAGRQKVSLISPFVVPFCLIIGRIISTELKPSLVGFIIGSVHIAWVAQAFGCHSLCTC